MGCSPTKLNKNTFISVQAPQNVSTIKDLKITEGMLVQENKGNPFENYDQVKVLGEGTFGKVFLVKNYAEIEAFTLKRTRLNHFFSIFKNIILEKNVILRFKFSSYY